MKKFLLPEHGEFYKANLHCHSTVSDGMQTVEEIKRDYMERGYSIVAYTDHDVMIPHHELTDERFLALTGYEMEVNQPEQLPGSEEIIPISFRKTCHMCFVALDPDKKEQVCFHRTKYLHKKHQNYALCYDHDLPDYEREYSHECICDMMRIGRENGFFVTYNHPNWSQEDMRDYMGYEHMHAMEICNGECVATGYPDDYNGREYDQMLRGGKRIYCIATDDNHGIDCGRRFVGFTMIKAEKLEYKTITDALLAGHFYASRGPEIHALWVEDGRIHITCSDAKRIIMTTGFRTTQRVVAPEGGVVNEADFALKAYDGYVRLTVWDEKGMYAATNAYFVDELLAD